jgi:hypothetical protein
MFFLLTDDNRTRGESFGNNRKHFKPCFVLQNSFLQGIQIILKNTISIKIISAFRSYSDTIKTNTETLTDASKEAGLKINIEKTKYMLLSHHQNAGQKQDIKIPKILFKNASQFKYLGQQ